MSYPCPRRRFLFIFNSEYELIYTCFTYTEIYKFLYPTSSKLKSNKVESFSGVTNSIRQRVNFEYSIIAENNKQYFIVKNPDRKDNLYKNII